MSQISLMVDRTQDGEGQWSVRLEWSHATVMQRPPVKQFSEKKGWSGYFLPSWLTPTSAPPATTFRIVLIMCYF